MQPSHPLKATRRLFCGGLATLLVSRARTAEPAITDLTLANGLRVILAHRPEQSDISTQLYCDAGVAHETAGTSGISHVLRHMFVLQAQAAGWKDQRGHTRLDANTVLMRGLQPDALARYLAFDAARLREPDFTHFENARRRVIAERTQREAGWLLEEVRRTAYSAHPVGNPMYGSPGDLERLTSGDVRAYWQRLYAPANMILTVIGAVSHADAEKLARAAYAPVPARAKPAPLRAVEPPQRAEKRLSLPPQDRAAVIIAYHRGCVDDPTYAVWGTLGPLAGARLTQRLTKDRQLAERVHTDIGMAAMKYPGLFTALAFVTKGVKAQTVEEIITAELDSLKNVEAAEADAYRRKTPDWTKIPNDALGAELADWQAMTGDWRRMFRDPDDVAAVTLKQVRDLAAATFRNTNRTVASVELAS